MAKFPFEIAVGFMTETVADTYNATLEAITTSWTAAAGLILGDPESGIGESGLSLTIGRSKRDKAFLSGSFTRSLSDFLKAEVPSFEFSFPFCGSRITVPGAPLDIDAVPIVGLSALLNGAGLAGPSVWGAGVGERFVFGSPLPISALIFYNGNRIRLQGCRCALSIEYTPGSIAIATATIEASQVLAPTVAAIPSTLTYGEQASVSAPVVQAVANAWQETRGFEELTLSIEPTFEDFPDSNAPTGTIKEQSDRETKISARLFSDDADKGYDLEQILATTSGELDTLTFQVGPNMTTGNPAVAHQVNVPQPELLTTSPQKLGTKAGTEIELAARHTTANFELEIIFR